MFNINLIHVPVHVFSDLQLTYLSAGAVTLSKIAAANLKHFGTFYFNTFKILESVNREASEATLTLQPFVVAFALFRPIRNAHAQLFDKLEIGWKESMKENETHYDQLARFVEGRYPDSQSRVS